MKTAIDDLILPGFDHVGVDTHAGREWAAGNLVRRVVRCAPVSL